jgi:hypothetical protein
MRVSLFLRERETFVASWIPQEGVTTESAEVTHHHNLEVIGIVLQEHKIRMKLKMKHPPGNADGPRRDELVLGRTDVLTVRVLHDPHRW